MTGVAPTKLPQCKGPPLSQQQILAISIKGWALKQRDKSRNWLGLVDDDVAGGKL
jgi:hypothetical protein